ncbi:MAG: hypothetical protein ABSH51_03635 [Solirubrobacteraceae bacterium]|jgi:hypothetical protein
MDGAWLHRARWRWRGALLWPTFVAGVVVDGVIAHARPMAGDSGNFYGGILLGLIVTLPAVLALSRPLGALIRRRRSGMPASVARNYGGAAAVVAVSAIMLIIGLAHHATVLRDESSLRDATVRAEAYIGDHAPAEFRVNAYHTDTFVIEPGSVYRTCVPSRDGTRTYCVIVKERLPLAQSVVFSGYESNALFGEGVN